MSHVEYQPPLNAWSHVWRLLLMLVLSVGVWFSIAEKLTPGRFILDIALGAVAYVAIWFRRRYPIAVAVIAVVASGGSAIAAGPAVLATTSLATFRVWTQVVGIGLFNMVASTVFAEIHPATQVEPYWLTLGSNVLATAAILAIGMYIGSRRELLWTLRVRAERAEAERELRAQQSRLEERSRIAREMHDVLAHRISQISMQAGALGYREDLSAVEVREGVTVIRDAANQALDDLRDVLGVLRDGDGPQHAPQPTYGDVGSLVEDARATGLRVVYADDVAADEAVPDAAGRTLYRIVQEGITNARKHAPGAELSIEVHGSPDAGITVSLRNPLGFGPTATPGSGLGLVGLAERAALRGGHLEHTRDHGEFVLHGWIPWAA